MTADLAARMAAHLDEHADIVTYLDEIARDDWLELRKQGVGASDAATVLGVSPWRSAYHAWAVRRGLIDPQAATPAMVFGQELEPLVYRRYEQATGRPVVPASVLVRAREHPFMLCTPDAYTCDGAELGLIEAKTVNFRQADKWGPDQAPIDYVAQAMHQLIVCRVDFVDLVPLMLNTGALGDIVRIRYDDGIARELIAREAEWWQHVIDGTAPPVDGSTSTAQALTARWQRHSEHTVELDADTAAAWRRARALAHQIKTLEERHRAETNLVRAAVGDASTATVDGTPVLTYRAHDEHRIDLDRLRAEQPDIAERYTVVAPKRVLRAVRPPRTKEA